METLADNYVRYYKLQEGGRLPVFVGQDGDGLGDILKGALRTVLPFLFPVVKGALNTFMDTAQRGMSEGKGAKEIFTSGLKSGLQGGFEGAKGEFARRMTSPIEQSGSGRKRKRRSTHKVKTVKRRREYKKGKSKRKGKTKRKFRKIAFKTNF